MDVGSISVEGEENCFLGLLEGDKGLVEEFEEAPLDEKKLES
jgi:hypothetical protein